MNSKGTPSSFEDYAVMLGAIEEYAKASAQRRNVTTVDGSVVARFNTVREAAANAFDTETLPPLPRLDEHREMSIEDFLGHVHFSVSLLQVAATRGSAAIEQLGDNHVADALARSATDLVAYNVAKAADARGDSKPRVFLGSSTEGVQYANIIQVGLERKTTCVVWNQGVFGLSSGTLETVVSECRNFSFAVLVLTPDDTRIKGNQPSVVPRDNVIFELGLFMGALGRDRVFILVQKGTSLPTDLAGVTTLPFDAPDISDIISAMGPIVTRLELAMNLF
jgi:predicted nucleotide-binding protein